jgi:hypothetical protein
MDNAFHIQNVNAYDSRLKGWPTILAGDDALNGSAVISRRQLC